MTHWFRFLSSLSAPRLAHVRTVAVKCTIKRRRSSYQQNLHLISVTEAIEREIRGRFGYRYLSNCGELFGQQQ
ncbi:hypothetical protein Y032_0059g3024 [Ancylostoma ceylanicum]|uniref:Uncharacterized protein n=1 Tax=Ancylostoma ceylanicum TaxID=53326 RepID=A0A016U4H5_9BILA|nr:hypothetical protein Y032_0059g3024 [Ancylostoma ceylanicum]